MMYVKGFSISSGVGPWFLAAAIFSRKVVYCPEVQTMTILKMFRAKD
jgi:hypothetical protein